MAVSVKSRILLGFGLILVMLVASAAVSSILITGIDTHFGEFRQALERKSQADTFDLVTQQVRVRVNQWLRSMNPTFAKQADELLEKSVALLAKAKVGAATDNERTIAGDIDVALTAYIKSWHVIQELYASEAKLYAERIDAPGAGIRAGLAKIRDGETAGKAPALAKLVADARDGFMAAEASAAHYRATLSKDDAVALDAAIAGVLASLDKAAPVLAGSADAASLKDAVAAIGAWRATFAEAVTLADTRVARLDSWTKNEGEAMAVGTNALRAEGQTAAAAAQEAVDATIARSHVTLYVSVGIVLLVGIALSLLLARSITGPLARMTEALKALAAGDRSLEVPETQRRDEIGAMAQAAQVFKDNAIAMERMRAEQEQQKQRAEEERHQAMLALAAKFEASVGDIVDGVTAQATELQATAQSMASTSEETSRQSTTVAAAAEQAAQNVNTVATATEELSSSVGEILQQVNRSTQMIGEAVAEANGANDQMRSLATAAQKIGEVVNLISNIASQTNLLALNATIEAARAGEAGKGFAVVASEVKTLANQTAKATEEISSQVNAIQKVTKVSAQSMESVNQRIGKVSETATAIASAVEQQGAATREIARNVSEAAKGTTEVTSNISGVSEAAQLTGAAASQVLASARELSQQSEALKSQVEAFLSEVRAA